MGFLKTTAAIAATALFATQTYAKESNSEIEALKAEIAELREVTQTLVDETSSLKTGVGFNVIDTSKSYSGLASAASKVYYSKSPLSIGGYGEMYYAYNKEEGASKLDVYRFVPYIGYKFSDNIILNAEIEFEHGGAKDGEDGYAIVEFMYLDFLINKYANIRAGHMLVPIGLINERHEPNLFTTVQRPASEKYIIPSTWHDSGVMVYGQLTDEISYKFAAISALKTDVNGDKWLRNGRGSSFKQTDPNLGVVARVDYNANGLLVGGSVYTAPSTDNTSSDTTIADIHFDYKNSGFRAYGVYAYANRTNAEDINATAAVQNGYGGYINASFDILTLTKSSDMLPIFVQYEKLAPQNEIVGGTSVEATEITTVGLNYFPHEQVVVKLDHAMQKGGFGKSDTTSVSLGFIF